ncbi:tRNA (adenosine(37)-N6)-threonylcarbamoyltransferase complex dimerization subunit type 1 TsaB [Notoacmeibacter ruber]|uniref:tRNA (Adenosine(37)-N6)-threonylcarbamoyltransferase complex dimerization subunit type 1 TsaB n=1 Tax=Notoacmeibacter ruber TaxID=2670375 RepID=A0A3L7J8M9_9HYPH|nr:tRNA (adenosine(37)-N6)-threonylcarbamoyltransferase complex dimerization subunit type 1 TsaB [Notoacmeibacter ruber]RLQ86976.1 tRNA (adenosine(37)-N6)-threonylcarbamoyltransferase complex dimerization subunit type 1 TsaB [Notoacmeibacter ruber]
MVLLALDTASPICAVALMDADGALLSKEVETRQSGHAERLLPMVQSVLQKGGRKKNAITKIVVSVGPGSFTGVRTAIAAARGLALALSVPAVGVTTLEAMALDGRRVSGEGTGPILAAIDAGRGEVYAAAYDADGECILGPEKMPYGHDLAGATVYPVDDLFGVGNGISHLGLTVGAMPDARTGAIETFASIGLLRQPGAPPEPLYLRAADAKPPSSKARIARQA